MLYPASTHPLVSSLALDVMVTCQFGEVKVQPGFEGVRGIKNVLAAELRQRPTRNGKVSRTSFSRPTQKSNHYCSLV